jgi:hypothetical protein
MKPPHAQSLPAIIAIIAATLLSGCGKKEGAQPSATNTAPPPAAAPATTPATTPTATPTAAPTATPNPAFVTLPGKWLRPDGGYILDIRSIAPDGNMDAGYFNPNPIHVAKAVASREGAKLKVFIELRDVNYPGSTYTLSHDAASDQLKGIYFQAVQQQNFEVIFTRVKP